MLSLNSLDNKIKFYRIINYYIQSHIYFIINFFYVIILKIINYLVKSRTTWQLKFSIQNFSLKQLKISTNNIFTTKNYINYNFPLWMKIYRFNVNSCQSK